MHLPLSPERLLLARILDEARILLWTAQVKRVGENFRWDLALFPESQHSPLLQYSHFPTQGNLWSSANSPDFAHINQTSRDALARGASGYRQQFRINCGAEFLWLDESAVIEPTGPDQWRISGIIRDVTQAKLTEDAERQASAKLHRILEHAECLLWQAAVTDDGSATFRWDFLFPPSGMLKRIFDEADGRKTRRLYAGFDVPQLPAMTETAKAAMRSGSSGYHQEFAITRRRDGETFWIREQVVVTPGDVPNRWNLSGVMIDITVRKLAELQLTTEKERLAVTLRAMEEAVVTIGLGGEVTFLNRAAEWLLQVEPGAALGRPFSSLARLETGTPPQPAAWPLDRPLRDDTSHSLPRDAQLLRPSGPPLRIEGCVAPLHDAQSASQGAVIVLRDVTERHVLQAHLQRASNLESVGLLAGGIAHDFNNILTALSLNLSLAQTEVAAGSELATHLAQAEAATDRASKLARQLLTFAKGGEPLLSAVNLAEVIDEVARFSLRGARVGYVLDLAPDLWPAKADRGQLAQIIQNLVLNAAQAMPHGGSVEIAAHNTRLEAPAQGVLAAGDYVLLTISDTGAGIAPDVLARIFTPYFTTKKEGHGLGLAVTYSIVKKHGGTIECRSTPGAGTTFEIHLPAARQPTAPIPASSPAAAVTRGRVLVMDDEEPIRRVLQLYLRRSGMTVETTADGAEAVASYRAAFERGERFDLIIMDLTVPGKMGGREAMAAILAIDPQARAVVASGYSSDPVLARYWEYGFRAVAPKPYDIQHLSRVIATLLDEPAVTAALAPQP